ncbi:MAG: hypothetical protein ABIN10_09790 [Specibacter sp.]
MALINTLAFPYAVAVCDSSLRTPRSSEQVDHFAAPDDDPFRQTVTWKTDSPQGRACSVDELLAAAQFLPSRAAQLRTMKVIGFASGLSGSAGESLSRVRMFEMGFPVPVLQQKFELGGGRNEFVDFWFKKQRIVGEFDGNGKYLREDWGGICAVGLDRTNEQGSVRDVRSGSARD